MDELHSVAEQARACRLCEAELPLGPRPVLRVSTTAPLLIVGQAPGTRVHASGIPWDDASGQRLRDWMGIAAPDFYDESRVAILPVGLCYPGVLPRGGDKPPMKICAPTWHPRLLPLMPQIRLTLVVGTYAQARMLGPGAMTEHVRKFRSTLPGLLPLPHPSWRTIGWQARHRWFETELLPELRARVAALLG